MNHDEQMIRDFFGQIIGIVWNYDNGDQAILSFPGRMIKGYYRKQRNCTTDFYGRVISQGNTVMTLLK